MRNDESDLRLRASHLFRLNRSAISVGGQSGNVMACVTLRQIARGFAVPEPYRSGIASSSSPARQSVVVLYS